MAFDANQIMFTFWGEKLSSIHNFFLYVALHMKKYKFSLHVQLFHGCNQQRMTPQHHWPKRLHQKTHQVLKEMYRCGLNLLYKSNLWLTSIFIVHESYTPWLAFETI